ncbi:MAG TPA: endonuclease/exonuclease/phosphatase family protein [Dongiaceae bacterium]|nr:endonuclease/exonuclease/phosphatase family protein [Dongiaceae bacterium]
MPLRVMTLNVLYDSVRTLARPWPERRGVVHRAIGSLDPDVVCFQEVSSRQLAALAEDLTGYELIGGEATGTHSIVRASPAIARFAGRVQGDYYAAGEHCPIAVRRGIAVTGRGTFRLSSRRDLAAPAAVEPFVVNWVDIDAPGAGRCSVHTTHLGHRQGRARRMAEGLLTRLDGTWRGEAQIVTGDLNTTPDSAVMRTLLGARDSGRPAFRDAWREAGRREGPASTFHWGRGWPGPRLDYILVRPAVAVPRAVTTRGASGGVFPSDHAAVMAEVVL